MTDEELLQHIENQYRATVQMNKLLREMIEMARERNLVREMFRIQETIGADYQDRPPMVL
jgi:hypothetical protein